ncbi:MAG: hypothetical protein Q8M16_01085 [Pirellulaceae bacterium]|nr:hypothetical protein [Pirellulaceae bacterium]
MLMPMLSEADPKVSAEGSIDPLGMYSIADSLAVRLIPGVRERQTHPRFLTSIAVSLSLCSEFDEDAVAADGVSEPWQVFEWYLVEGLVRSTEDRKSLSGLPGQEKASRAKHDGVPLSEKRYLKSPTVFGFHGVYRALARDLEVERAARLGEVGHKLLTTWEQEQGLTGFAGTAEGEGKHIRKQLLDAVRDGLHAGAVDRKPGWPGWKFFSDHLGIYEAGDREAKVIADALLNPGSGFRSEVLRSLVSSDGQDLWTVEAEQRSFSERRFHELVRVSAGHALQELLDAISAYEQFSRLMLDAFEDCLFHMSPYQNRIKPEELGSLKGVTRAAKRIPVIFADVAEKLSAFGEAIRFQDAFHSLAERMPATQWVERLLDHHCRVQHDKPPEGKAPWFDRFDDGSCMIRTGYEREGGARHDDAFVHAYRTKSLWSFARDLRLVKQDG